MQALKKLNFLDLFLSWVYACISTTKFSVKVNGALKGYFSGAKGMRQGDPISPYLFTIAMNMLSCLLAKTPLGFKYHWKCKNMQLTHLFFADDVILFSHGDSASLSHIMTCLTKFSNMSGLYPSLHKSMVFFFNCGEDVTTWFDGTYGIPHGNLPVKFLGVPLISSRLGINDCRPLIERITSRIISWTTLMLSFTGRARLIKAILLSIQSYWSNHFLLPGATHKTIQQLLTRFLWKGEAVKKGGARVSWQRISVPRSEGGLGLHNPRNWNVAQILLHLCKVIGKHNFIWSLWVHSTTLKKHCFWTMDIPTDCTWIWKKLLQLRTLARRFLIFQHGNGNKTSF